MSDNYWDEPVYADVEREARGDWIRERPPADHPAADDETCDRCRHFLCRCNETRKR